MPNSERTALLALAAFVSLAMLVAFAWLARWHWYERGLNLAVRRQHEKGACGEYETPLDEHHVVKAIWQRWIRLRPSLARHGYRWPPKRLEARIRRHPG